MIHKGSNIKVLVVILLKRMLRGEMVFLLVLLFSWVFTFCCSSISLFTSLVFTHFLATLYVFFCCCSSLVFLKKKKNKITALVLVYVWKMGTLLLLKSLKCSNCFCGFLSLPFSCVHFYPFLHNFWESNMILRWGILTDWNL